MWNDSIGTFSEKIHPNTQRSLNKLHLICGKDYSKAPWATPSPSPPQIVVASYKPKLWYKGEKYFYREAFLSYGIRRGDVTDIAWLEIKCLIPNQHFYAL